MTDHKADAERLLVRAKSGQVPVQHSALTREALVSATLYLAEQQRIANLIALATCDLTAYDFIVESKEDAESIKAQIREGVGI